MKYTLVYVAAIVVFVAGILTAAVIFNNHESGSVQQSSSHNDDVLNSANLVPILNGIRVRSGLNELQIDDALTKEAEAVSSNAAEKDLADAFSSDSFTIRLKKTDLVGEAPLLYYSAESFAERAVSINEASAVIVKKNVTHIGVWTSYIIRTKGASPVPYTTVIIR